MTIPPVAQVYATHSTRHSTDYPFVKYPQYVPTAYKRKKEVAEATSADDLYDEVILSDEARAWLESQKEKKSN